MKLSYDPVNLSHCKAKGCPNDSEVIICRTVGSEYGKEAFLAYCRFHAIIANDFFGTNERRIEIKGIRP